MTINQSVVSPILFLLLALFTFSSCSREKPAVLIFSKTDGFYHQSIPTGIEAIQLLGMENGFDVDTTTSANMFTEEHLQNYSAVIFLNTTGDVLNNRQETEMERFIQSGGGFVGVHAAADTEYHWGWYGRLVGGYFQDHPIVQEGVIEVVDHSHPSTEFLSEEWVRTDEWYSYKDLFEDINVLMELDEDSYEGGTEMGDHPIAWYHEYDGGRSFYTGLGHTNESYTEDLFLKHLLAGIEYAIGNSPRPDYSVTTTSSVPEENRFTKTQLVVGELSEPTEMAILPNLDILIAQRRGEILLYNNADSTLSEAGMLDVYWQTDVEGVNAEEGVIGIQVDPNFEDNSFVYIFYAPTDTSINRISRFQFENDALNMESETVVLEFFSQRDICCHTGGSLAFDSEGLLYASTGDNTTPFNQTTGDYFLHGFAPLDAREGYEQYNARRSSGNSNDLRGKILRIDVNEDGSYDIPEGNLYPVGTPNTRPEIYVQGTRNPYRISIDPKTNDLYWGDVGPDANNDSLDVRGPRGYDEINQAKQAGHYGWPFFVGDNYPYREYDFDTGTPGDAFSPERPINRSPFNTGIEVLPPAQPAFIWYPYTESEEFPLTGSGGRNALAGPVFYTDLYPEETRMPDYYNGKLFIYDWIRDWVRVVTMQDDGSFDKMEPFMDSTTFNGVIDMEMGPDGKLYLLEYGKGWFSQNTDSGIARIDFNAGNRIPIIHSTRVEETSGLLPFNAVFHVDASDPENDPLRYTWHISNGETVETNEPVLEYMFDQVGEYKVRVDVSDPEGMSVMSEEVAIYAGNVAPKVIIDIEGNQSFYFDGVPIEYNVLVEDEGSDGVTAEINPENLFVDAEFTDESSDDTSEMGHQIITEAMVGKNMVSTLDCRACHSEVDRSVGPSYMEISERYQDQEDAQSYLIDQVINGSSGVWGEVAMPAHLDLPQEDARKIVAWIRSLAQDENTTPSLPKSSSLSSDSVERDSDSDDILVFSASYTNETEGTIRPLTGYASRALRSNVLSATDAQDMIGYQVMEFGGQTLLLVPAGDGSFSFGRVDLSGLSSIEIIAGSQEPIVESYKFEVRIGSPDGNLVGEGVLQPESVVEGDDFLSYTFNIELNSAMEIDSESDIYILSSPIESEEAGNIALISFRFVME